MGSRTLEEARRLLHVLNESVLVLNSGMVPIDICTVRKAVLDVLRSVAVPVRDSDQVLHSPSTILPVPRVISYHSYHKIPRKRVRFTRLNVIYRDDQRCAYCSKHLPVSELTVDHIVPRSRWKRIMGTDSRFAFNSWENLVAACRRCNAHKGDRLLRELGWHLERSPSAPDYLPYLVIRRQKAERLGWLDFCTHNVRLVETA